MTLKVKKFRAINNAPIDLDGITVIAGENGSGKSTLSKILYETIKYSKKYELLIIKELNAELRDIPTALLDLVQEIARYEDSSEAKKLLSSARSSRGRLSLKSGNIESIQDYESKLNSFLDIINDYVVSLPNQGQLSFEDLLDETYKKRVSSSRQMRINRVGHILRNVLDNNDKSNLSDSVETLNLLRSKISATFEKVYENYDSRPISLFSKQLHLSFHQPIANKFDLVEYGLPITDWKNKKLNNTSWIKSAIYVDTPMAINRQNRLTDRYWSELNNELQSSNVLFSQSHDFNDITNIITGEVYYDDDIFDDGYKYKRNDGRVFNIDECATGIKAFGILQLLLNNGKLTKDTLLIVDEPEAHLHPQWIVEYARIVVLLNKQIGVKFFIASHNPDMVSAIKYIAEKEDVSDRVNFYLAKKRPNDYTYDYKALKTDIEPIFSSFNIAIERINQYGAQDA